MDNTSRSSVTYGTLKKALLSLGFTETPTETHLLYENSDSGAVILLPKTEDDQPAQTVHLLTARWTTVEMGLTDGAAFDRMLSVNGGRSKARLQTTVRPPHPARPRRSRLSSEQAPPSPAQIEAA